MQTMFGDHGLLWGVAGISLQNMLEFITADYFKWTDSDA